MAMMELTAHSFPVQRTTWQMVSDRGYTLPRELQEPEVKDFHPANEAIFQPGAGAGGAAIQVYWVASQLNKAQWDNWAPLPPQVIIVADSATAAVRVLAAARPGVELWNTLQLTFNFTRHKLVPPHTQASPNEIKTLGNPLQLPRIRKTDVVVRYYAWPVDTVVKICRPNGIVYYRRVVA
jgi:DNA-directed RNA polymerase subunit H (RpoH/RPB5)